jgi:HNH endonuclease
MAIPAHLRRQVDQRAQNRCEYCGLAQAAQKAAFHIDHVVPVSAGGKTALDNLALACVSCSLRKGARQFAADPLTSTEVALFNPRRDSWRLHFRWQGVRIQGISPTGRATVAALKLNRPMAQAIREEETTRGRHPSPRHL